MTTVSGRVSHARISAVEMLRGPDHMATRTSEDTVVQCVHPGTLRFGRNMTAALVDDNQTE